MIAQPHDTEVGAGTFYPTTFLRALGPEPWRVAGTAPSRRPADGRYGDNPYRFQYFFQYQVVLKPSPLDVQDLYLNSLYELGIDPHAHDIRFVEDNWESPTLGAWGLGCERIAMYLQNVDHGFDIQVAPGVTMGDLRRDFEVQHSTYNFEKSDPDLQRELFDRYEAESRRLNDEGLLHPSYEFVLKASHAFNLLDARGVLSHTERQNYVQRVRRLAEASARSYVAHQEATEGEPGGAGAPDAGPAEGAS